MKQAKTINLKAMKGRMHSLIEFAKNRKRTAFALLAAFLMIGSVGVYFTYMHTTEYHSGIPVNISVKFSGTPPGISPFVKVAGYNTTYYNNQNVFFSLISDVPMGLNLTAGGNYVNLTGMNITNNPYVISILSGRESSGGDFSSYLGNNFFNLARQWRESGISNQSQVSVMLQAEYSFVLNGKIYEYRYYNNIPYSPFSTVFNDLQTFRTIVNSPTISLDSKIFFNLSHPAYVGAFNISDLHHATIVNSKIHTDGIIGGGSGGPNNPCPYPPDCYQSNYPCCDGIAHPIVQKSWTGMLPLSMATMELPSESTFVTGVMSAAAVTNMHFNTAEACQVDTANTQVMDSTSGSFNTGSITALTELLSVSNTTGANQMVAYLPNVTFSVTEYQNEYPETIYANGNWYCGVTYGTPYTVMKVDDATSTQVCTQAFYSLANNGNVSSTTSIWGAVLNSLGMKSVLTQTLKPNHSQQSFDYSSYAKEYNNAKTEMATVNNAIGTFTAAMGVALAINAATGIIPGGATADDIVNGISLATAEVGLSSAIITDMSSISIQVTIGTHFNLFVLSNQAVLHTSGSSLSYTVFQSTGSTPIFFIDPNSGNSYNFNTPMDYFSAVPIS